MKAYLLTKRYKNLQLKSSSRERNLFSTSCGFSFSFFSSSPSRIIPFLDESSFENGFIKLSFLSSETKQKLFYKAFKTDQKSQSVEYAFRNLFTNLFFSRNYNDERLKNRQYFAYCFII